MATQHNEMVTQGILYSCLEYCSYYLDQMEKQASHVGMKFNRYNSYLDVVAYEREEMPDSNTSAKNQKKHFILFEVKNKKLEYLAKRRYRLTLAENVSQQRIRWSDSDRL